MAAAPERAHKMVVTTEFSQASADCPESRQVSADRPESRHVTTVRPESRNITAVCPESRHVTTDCPETRHVTADRPESRLLRLLRLLRRGGLLLRLLCCGGLLSYSGGLLLRCGIFGPVCSAVVALSSTCAAGSAPLPCSAGPASVPMSYTSTWTWPSIPPPVPPPLHHPPGLYSFWSIWKPLLGGALSWILSGVFCLLAIRGRLPITLTLTLHKLLHVTLDYISHAPLHWLQSHLQAITHTSTLNWGNNSGTNRRQVISARVNQAFEWRDKMKVFIIYYGSCKRVSWLKLVN